MDIAEEMSRLRLQNDQLSKTTEKQRVMIQCLQQRNVKLATERNRLEEKVGSLERRLRKKHSTSFLVSSDARKEMEKAPSNSPESTSPIEESDSDDEQNEADKPANPLQSAQHELRMTRDAVGQTAHRRPLQNWRSKQANLNSSSNSPSNAIIQKDAQLYALYQSTVQKNNNTSASESNNLSPQSSSPSSIRVNAIALRNPTSRVNQSQRRSMMITTEMDFRKPCEDIYIEDCDEEEQEMEEEGQSEEEKDKPSCSGDMHGGDLQEKLRSIMSDRNVNVRVNIIGTRLKINENAKEVISFIISITRRHSSKSAGRDSSEELWRVEKLYSDFLRLDAKLKSQTDGTEESTTCRLPTQPVFASQTSNKIDQRKSPPRREGYLKKRGKNFGKWKTRYFVLRDAMLDYYDTKNGTKLGSIRLTNAFIGRQAPPPSVGAEGLPSTYRHALLIVEQKRPGHSSIARHILCASSDEERNGWCESLTQTITPDGNTNIQHSKAAESLHIRCTEGMREAEESKVGKLQSENTSDRQNSSDDPDVCAPEPKEERSFSSSLRPNSPSYTNKTRKENESSTLGTSRLEIVPERSITTDYVKVMPRSINDNEESTTEKKFKAKANRMTIWGRKMFSAGGSHVTTTQESHQSRLSNSSVTSTDSWQTSSLPSGFRSLLSRSSHEIIDASSRAKSVDCPVVPAKRVFGVPLEEAISVSRISEKYEIPAVVFRCIEYLDAKDAVMEEGLYRLSGSNTVIQNLKQKFDQEGDLNLLASKEEYDVHAIAGLLKLWLRELPSNIFTDEREKQFMHVIDLLDRKDRVNELGRLVSELPLANYTLLRTLTAHLIRVIEHSHINKMPVRNIVIVFAPTLTIPPTIFQLFLCEFEYIFWTTEDGTRASKDGQENKEASDKNHSDNEDVKEKDEPMIRKSSAILREEGGRSNRNSMSYLDGAPIAIVDLEKNIHGPPELGEEEEVDDLVLQELEDENPKKEDIMSARTEEAL
ncbi:hypothetical protein EC973_009549 [Apophysomyces ossiformis]|uniref:Uncharacterized protein n=1 Tax=Apophysomyces ossiformis TaxID=679940 RepID=A0A8H7BRU1_9FUNG|nr:hypothetical protein EC973_009549 [Apophysomyces ossiformis]